MHSEARFKRGVREILLKKRDSIEFGEKKIKELAIRKRLFASSDYKKANNILFYASFRSEVDTMQCIQHALGTNKIVALPCVDNKKKELKLYTIKGIAELKSGYMGIQEPKILKNRKISLRDIDMVIIPGAGFDVHGNRLGYGFGYYDKLLGHEPNRPAKSGRHVTSVALAFEEQIVPRVPEDKHDVRVDKIITEKRIIDCKKVESRM